MRLPKAKFQHLEWFVIALFVSAGAMGLARAILTQDVVWVSDGLGWDGVSYIRLLEFFRDGKFSGESVAFPFCGRIGTAYILSLLPSKASFYGFNILCGILVAASMVTIAIQYVGKNTYAITAALFISLFLYYSPVKISNFYPVYMDPPFILLSSLSMIFASRGQYLIAALFCLLAIPFREAAVYIIPLLAIFSTLDSKNKARSLVIFFIIAAMGFFMNRLFLGITGCQHESQLTTAFWWIYKFLTNPFRFISICAGISMTIAPIFLIPGTGNVLKFYSIKKLQLPIIAIIYFGIISVAGGSDITRIFYSFVPFYSPIVFVAFSRASLSGAASSLSGWIITNQSLNEYLQPITELPNYDMAGTFSQTPDHGHPVVSVVILAIWWIFSLAKKILEQGEIGLAKVMLQNNRRVDGEDTLR